MFLCQSIIMMMLIRKMSVGHNVGLTLSAEKIKEHFMGLDRRGIDNNNHLLLVVLR